MTLDSDLGIKTYGRNDSINFVSVKLEPISEIAERTDLCREAYLTNERNKAAKITGVITLGVIVGSLGTEIISGLFVQSIHSLVSVWFSLGAFTVGISLGSAYKIGVFDCCLRKEPTMEEKLIASAF